MGEKPHTATIDFGNLTERIGTTENDYLYCGEQFNATTGLYYLRARYMNPSTGTFISMDVYQGSIFDPVSLHKYLYANANPIMNSAPTGYFTLTELNVTTKIQGILAKISQPRVKFAMDILNFLISAVDTGVQISRMIEEGASAEEILDSIARGLITSVFLNEMCKIKAVGPYLGKLLIVFGFVNQYKSIEQAIEEGDTSLAVLRSVQMGIMGLSLYDSCFTGETLVATEDGQKRIDEIQLGDKVWAYNVETDQLELKEVVAVFVRETKELIHLTTSTDKITTTSNHPFYVIGKGWVAAGDLEVGDEFYALDGTTSTVLKWECEELEEAITVYNMEVEDFHTYFVGEYGVLVHNEYDAAGGGESKGGSKADTFTIDDWTGYPDATKPNGPFRIIDGDEYNNARKLANSTNAKLHRQYSHLDGLQIHEMHPIKFGGSPIDIDNKIALTPKEHAKYTTFWNKILYEENKK